jgi:integrase
MLKEHNVRTGFFERAQFESVCGHLPKPVRAVIRFAYVTGWRIDSEILPLLWRQVNFSERLTPSQKLPGTVRLDAGTTKNDEGRVFPFTEELRDVLEAQHAEHLRLKNIGQMVPWVFFRMVAKRRRGPKKPKRITRFNKAWKAACVAAGAPGRIPHDLRRTAVRNLMRAGITERVAMRLTGHKTRSVFERYNIVSDGDLGAAAPSVNRSWNVDAKRCRPSRPSTWERRAKQSSRRSSSGSHGASPSGGSGAASAFAAASGGL